MTDDVFTRTERDAGLYERRRADMPRERPDPSEYQDSGCSPCEGEGFVIYGSRLLPCPECRPEDYDAAIQESEGAPDG